MNNILFNIICLTVFIISHQANSEIKGNVISNVQITPQGSVESTEQIQIRFPTDMIVLGREFDSPPPISSNCFNDRSYGYWTDLKTWVYTFSPLLRPGSICHVQLVDNLIDLKGQKVVSTPVEFRTMTAQIIKTYPSNYSQISEDQIFILELNGQVSSDWVYKNVYFMSEGLGDQIPVQVIEGNEKQKYIVSAQKAYNFNINSNLENESPKNFLVLKAQRRFARGHDIQLHWFKNFHFNVNTFFEAEFSCSRESANSGCSPLNSMRLNFNQEISVPQAQKIFLKESNGLKIYSKVLKDKNIKASVSNVLFEGPFKPNTNYELHLGNIRSIDNEILSNQAMFPLNVKTDQLPSLLKVSREFSVIESAHPVLPIFVRNIESPIGSRSIQQKSILGSHAVLKNTDVKNILDSLDVLRNSTNITPINLKGLNPFEYVYKKKESNDQLETVGIELKSTGFHFLEFKSEILGRKHIDTNLLDEKKQPNKNLFSPAYYVRAAALVTNIHLTMKHSKNEVLIWATTLDHGHPLVNARIKLYSSSAQLIKEATTNKVGLAYFVLTEKEYHKLIEQNPKQYLNTFYAFAEFGNDFSFISSNDTDGIEKYRYGLRLPSENPEMIYHAIFEKTLLRPGEVLKAKLIYRKIEKSGLSLPNLNLPLHVQITNDWDQKKYLTPVRWDIKSGTGVIEWSVPEEATLGSYNVSLPNKLKNNKKYEESATHVFGHFRVQVFKTQVILSELKALNIPWVNAQNHTIEFSAKYFSGGAAAFLPILVKYSLTEDHYYFQNEAEEEENNYRWLSGDVQEGLVRTDREVVQNQQPTIQSLNLKLNQYGIAQFDLKNLIYKNTPQRVVVSVEYKDPNGDIQSVSRAYPLVNSNNTIGIRQSNWSIVPNNISFDAKVLNIKQEPVTQKEVLFTLFKSDRYSVRKKLLGGFYSYETFVETKKIKDICRLPTNSKGVAQCSYTDASLQGNYIVRAMLKDDRGRWIKTSEQAYVYSETPWYGGENSDRMDLVSSKKSYEPGEIAEFHVLGPIQEGQLLLTVEQDRILHQQVIPFNSKNPFVKLKIKEDWSPNVVVSAALLRGRIDGQISGLLDLGKPSFKLGMSSIQIGTQKHMLSVDLKTDKEVYEPRETVKVSLKISNHLGHPVNGEVALAVVDEALLSLSPNNSWNLLQSMTPLRAHNFETSYLMSQVLGRRTLGLKAVPLGGDGAGSALRELFDTSIFWNPRVLVKNGEAQVEFKTNDALTSFKVVGIAQSGSEQFGTGYSVIKVKKDIQTFSSLALETRQGDHFLARFSVRNTTSNEVKLTAKLLMNNNSYEDKNVIIKSGKTQEVSWPIVSSELNENVFQFTLNNSNGKVIDQIRIKQKNSEIWPARTIGALLSQEKLLQVPVKKSSGTRDQIIASLIPSLAGALPGLKQFWDLYQFNCFEQQISKAVSLDSKELFEKSISKIDLYLDDKGFIKFYPMSQKGSLFLTNYVLQSVYYRGWGLPESKVKKTLVALREFFNHPQKIKTNDYLLDSDIEYLRLMTLDTLEIYGEGSPSMWTTLKIQIELLPMNYLAHALSILTTNKYIQDRQDRIDQIIQLIKSRSVLSSGNLFLKDIQNSINMSWHYTSIEQSQAKLLIQILAMKEFKQDGGRLILGFLNQMTNGSWKSTMDNAWGALALKMYHQFIENEKVKGTIHWQVSEKKFSQIISKQTVTQNWDLLRDGQFVSEYKGTGRPWLNLIFLSNQPINKDINHGIEVQKKWIPVEVKDISRKTVGDIWKIEIRLKSNFNFQWLALRDPLPSGVTIMDEESDLDFSESKPLEYRGYQSWFQKETKILYTMRFNQSGTYQLPTTRAEAMYDTDLYGEILNAKMVIDP